MNKFDNFTDEELDVIETGLNILFNSNDEHERQVSFDLLKELNEVGKDQTETVSDPVFS